MPILLNAGVIPACECRRINSFHLFTLKSLSREKHFGIELDAVTNPRRFVVFEGSSTAFSYSPTHFFLGETAAPQVLRSHPMFSFVCEQLFSVANVLEQHNHTCILQSGLD